MPAKIQFFSDSNLDGYLRHVEHLGHEVEVDHSTGVVTTRELTPRLEDEADNWGGRIVQYE